MALEHGFRLRQWEVQPDQNLLVGPDAEVRLAPRTMEVLVCLAERSGQVVTRDDFSERVWSPAIVTDNSLTRCISELRRQLGDQGDQPEFIQTIPKRGYRLVATVSAKAIPESPVGPAPTDTALAVLPFQAIGNGMSESIADGIQQDLLTRLSGLARLRVISSTSVRRYRDTDLALPEIARQLGVNWIIEGSVQHVGDQIQVNAQLIDAPSDHHRWARTYRKPYSAENLFTIQGEIMEDIARSLNATVGTEQTTGQTQAVDLEAYARYMQGRSFLDTRTPEGMRHSLVYFRAALEHDEHYAQAWVGIADALMLLYDYYDEGPAEPVRLQVRRALDRALKTEPELAEAHASKGLYYMCHSNLGPLRAEGLDGPRAVGSLQHALALRPAYAEAHNWLSWILQLLGDAETALKSAQRSIDLNPLSPESIHNVMSSNMASGNHARALREARRIEELDMYDATPQFYEAIALHHLGRFDAAVALLEDLEVEWTGCGAQAALAITEATRGNPKRANSMLAQIESSGDRFAFALVLAALGRQEESLKMFGQIEHWGQWPAMVVHHYYPEILGPFRALPEFGAIVDTMHEYYGLTGDDRRFSVNRTSSSGE